MQLAYFKIIFLIIVSKKWIKLALPVRNSYILGVVHQEFLSGRDFTFFWGRIKPCFHHIFNYCLKQERLQVKILIYL